LKGATGSEGPQGLKGATGVTGAQGEKGAQGVTGAQGTQGPAGLQGPAGAQGAQGLKGTTGADGAQGLKGATGAQGTPGTQGPAGAQGPTGAQGAAGIQGATGPAGVQGPKGATGPEGQKGSDAFGKIFVRLGKSTALPANSHEVPAKAFCPAGFSAIGGGGTYLPVAGAEQPELAASVSISQAPSQSIGWQALFTNKTSQNTMIKAQVICAEVGTVVVDEE
jgi:hypothetical protein